MGSTRQDNEDGLKFVWDAIRCELQDTSPMGDYILHKVLIAVNIIVFIIMLPFALELVVGSSPAFTSLKYLPSPACIASGGCLPQVLVSMFTHAGIAHLLGNMLFLYLMGDNVESVLGARRTLLVYFASGLVGASAESIARVDDLNDPTLAMVGASAAVSGLVGAYIVFYPGSTLCRCIGLSSLVYYCFRIKASNFLAIWLAFQLFLAMLSTYIAVWAHLAGLVTGIALARLLADPSRVDALRAMFRERRFKGLPIDPGELGQPSMSPLAQILVVLSVMSLGVALFTSVPQILQMDGQYYVVYAKAYVTEAELLGPTISILSVWAEVSSEPPDGGLVEAEPLGWGRYIVYNGREVLGEAVVVLAYYRLSHLVEMAIVTIVFVLVASAVALYTVLARPWELEVTYIPGLDGNAFKPETGGGAGGVHEVDWRDSR